MRETAKVDSPSPGNFYERDGKEERRIFRKMDMHLLPFVSLLYLLSFLFVSSCYPCSAEKANSARIMTGIGRMLVSGMLHGLPRALELNEFALRVGNAKIAGMATDLKLVGLRYNIIAAVFFVSSAPSLTVISADRPL